MSSTTPPEETPPQEPAAAPLVPDADWPADALRMIERFREALAAAERERETLARACQLRTDLLAEASHEIRQPMSSIVGAADLLLATALDETQREHAGLIRSSALGLLTTVNDLLDYARIEAGRLRLTIAPFDLRECIEDVLSLVAAQAHDKGIELIALIDPAVPRRLQGDATRLRQIMLNLAANALRYTNFGHILFKVDAQVRGDSVLLRIEVADTGVGFAAEVKDRLFMPFEQGEASQRRGQGSGLGLWICRKLVELMRGAIDVDSELGKGSRFWFQVELQTGAQPASVPPTFPETRQVLLMERHPLLRQSLEQTLRSWGLQVQACAGLADLGREFERPDLAVLGLSRRDLDIGSYQDHLQWLRARVDCPILVLVASGERPIHFRLRRLGAYSCLGKPVRERQLHGTVARLLGVPGRPPARRAGTATATTAATRRSPRTRPAILIVEDNAIGRRVFAELLERKGADVTAAASGLEALDAVAKARFDLIVMDMHMPGMDGVETTRRIRALRGAARNLPIVGLTADVVPEHRARFLEAGVSTCLSKPIESDLLWEALLDLLPDRMAATLRRGGSASAAPIIDRDEALRRASGSSELAAEVMGMLVEDLPGHCAAIAAAAESGDYALLGELAHTLAGSAMYCGAQLLTQAAERLEQAARTNEQPRVRRAVGLVEREARRYIRAARA